MPTSYSVTTSEPMKWDATVRLCRAYDTYHLWGYNRLAEEQGEGKAILFAHETKNATIAIPLLLRPIMGVRGINASGYIDATSVYGYPGPISTQESAEDQDLAAFWRALQAYLAYQKVVTVFSRLNPLFNQALFLKNAGDIIDIGPTVSINLQNSGAEQLRQYRSSLKYDIAHAKQEGVVCVKDEEWTHINEFIELYTQTMRNVGASDYYFFDEDYFHNLRRRLHDHVHLFVALRGDQVIGGSIFTLCNNIIQYHLSGTDPEHRSLSPSKVLVDAAREWGNAIGAKHLHLGGGVGSRRDGLYNFKAGFSNSTHTFRIWRAVVNQETYDQLVTERRSWCQAQGFQIANSSFFPAYRAPIG